MLSQTQTLSVDCSDTLQRLTMDKGPPRHEAHGGPPRHRREINLLAERTALLEEMELAFEDRVSVLEGAVRAVRQHTDELVEKEERLFLEDRVEALEQAVRTGCGMVADFCETASRIPALEDNNPALAYLDHMVSGFMALGSSV